MKILVIDNYDSFTYNLVQYLKEITNLPITVLRNDQFEIDEIAEYTHIILSPGPGVPQNAGLMPQVIEKYHKTHAILGVCLGHQALGEAFGAEIYNLDKVYHGIQHKVRLESGVSCPLLEGVADGFNAGRYHSWVIKEDTLPTDKLEITCRTEDGAIMGIQHKEYPVYGLQFHPESVMTDYGRLFLANFLGFKDLELPINEIERMRNIC